MIKNEMELLENKELRERLKERTEVLTKVEGLFLLPESEFAVTEQVANYYKVGKEAINSLVKDNRDEITEDGYIVMKGKEISESHVMSFKDFTSNRANYKFILEDETELSVGGKGIALFPKRAILRVGMLLRDSVVAKEIRTQLLNTFENASDEVKVNEIDKEKDLALKVMFSRTDEDRLIAMNEYIRYSDRYKKKAEYCDKVVSAPNGVTITQIAKELGFKSGQVLNKLLAENKIQYKNQKGQWLLYSDYAENGYTVPFTYIGNDGYTHHSSNWTEKGKKFIYDLLDKNELLAINKN